MKGGRISPIDRKIYHKATVFKAVCCFLSDKDISREEGPDTDRHRPTQTGTGPGTDTRERSRPYDASSVSDSWGKAEPLSKWRQYNWLLIWGKYKYSSLKLTYPSKDVQGQNVKILKPEVENMDYCYNLGIAKAFENNHQMHKL